MAAVVCVMLESFGVAPVSQRYGGDVVYVCVTGKVYHSTRSCRGLRKARHRVIAVTRDEAVMKYNRRACKVCY